MKTWPFGSHLVLERQEMEGADLLAIEYKYNKQKMILFITMKRSELTHFNNYYKSK